MVGRNPTFTQIQPNYLFIDIANRRKVFREKNPTAKIISLGVGDTTEEIPSEVVNGFCAKAKALGTREGYTGYPPFNGSEDLRVEIARYFYRNRIAPDEIFISDGSKPDLARLQFLFSPDCSVAVQDPVYPVYLDSSVISGKSGHRDPVTETYKRIVYMKCTPENNFFPDLCQLERTDLIFICSPNNPTGSAATRDQLTQLVQFAKVNKSIIVYDSAYSEFIREPELYPKSIFEIEGASEVAIETSSFSKVLGFTGVRLGWTVCPKKLTFDDGSSVHQDWARIMGTFFNGPSNLAEAGALAALQSEACIRTTTDFYLENARIVREGLAKTSLAFYGGSQSPYIWVKVPCGSTSWSIFQELLEKTFIVTTPGVGFGKNGEGFIRISAFAHREDVIEAMDRIVKHFANVRA